MIGKLKGTIDEIGDDYVLVDVHGVCYVAHCSSRTLGRIGSAGEAVVLFMATELYEIEQPERPEEHLEVVRFPFADLGFLIDRCRDAKSIIGLSLLRERLQAPGREAWRNETPG